MPRIFISYKTGNPNNIVANELYEVLKRHYGNPNVFLDTRQIRAGKDWDDTIYDAITDSDVLIVMVTKSAASDWVRREVDYARGCRVTIIPVVVFPEDLVVASGGTKTPAAEVLEQLALPVMQYAEALQSIRYPERYRQLIDEIDRLEKSGELRIEQRKFIRQLEERWKKEDDLNRSLKRADTNLNLSEFVHYPNKIDPHKTHIFLASGSITDLIGADVIVNSENTYMQMQRVFAPVSVSREIRLMGARGDWKNGYILEDTVQDALMNEAFKRHGKLPIQQCDVYVTAITDDQSSELTRRKFRFIYHVAVVNASRKGEEKLEANSDGELVVQTCVENCLNEVSGYNATNPGTPIRHIVIPLLGAGNAGLEVEFSAQCILNAVVKWLDQNSGDGLEGIHINAYRNCDVATVLAVFAETELRHVNGRKA